MLITTCLAVLALLLGACSMPAEAPPPPDPVGVEPAALEAEIELVERRTRAIRGLEPPDGTGETNYRIVDSATIGEVVESSLAEGDFGDNQALARLLQILKPDVELQTALEVLYDGAVLGLYEPETQELLVLGGADDDQLYSDTANTYSHEYIHLLQDLHYDLDALEASADGNDDHLSALYALVVGDATSVDTRYDELHAAGHEERPGPPPPLPDFSTVNWFLVRELNFPYIQGQRFVEALIAEGGYARVDEAYADPPRSSEQILHPDKYLGAVRDEPIDLSELGPPQFPSGWS